MYEPTTYDEMFAGEGQPHDSCRAFVERLEGVPVEELRNRQIAAEVHLNNMGITFNVYGHEAGTEKVWPFDVLPRIIDGAEWDRVEAGLKQRVTALNLFIDDLYNDQKVLEDGGRAAEHLIETASSYRPELRGFSPTNKAWCHISGVDLVRDRDGQFYVLEDNLRCPSGVSYVLENREIMKRTFSTVFQGMAVVAGRSVPRTPATDAARLRSPHIGDKPRAVVLTPGVFNSAYFEHTFLAQQMGVELVQGVDLTVIDDVVYMRTTRGLQTGRRHLPPDRRRLPRPGVLP